ncbi:MAG: hypothetical protein QMA99_03045 [Flavobacterium sp.]
MKKTLLGLLLVFIIVSANAQLKSPGEFLPNYGKQISQYHQVEAYFGQLLMESPNIKKQKYGVTN